MFLARYGRLEHGFEELELTELMPLTRTINKWLEREYGKQGETDEPREREPDSLGG